MNRIQQSFVRQAHSNRRKLNEQELEFIESLISNDSVKSEIQLTEKQNKYLNKIQKKVSG